MNTHEDVKEFLTPYINTSSLYGVYINKFSRDITYSYDLKDKFYIVIQLDSKLSEDKLKKVEEKLVNQVKRVTTNNNVLIYHVIVTKDELIQMVDDIGTYSVVCYVNHFTINHDTYIKTRNYISDHFNVNAAVIDGRSYIDGSSFYIILQCRPGQVDIHKELLGDYCESIEDSVPGWHIDILRIKNVNEQFMSKFNLISESLGSKIHGLVIGSDYYKRFEGRSL